jgi:hypothetical protein
MKNSGQKRITKITLRTTNYCTDNGEPLKSLVSFVAKCLFDNSQAHYFLDSLGWCDPELNSPNQ